MYKHACNLQPRLASFGFCSHIPVPLAASRPLAETVTDNLVIAGYGVDCNNFSGIAFVPDAGSTDTFLVPSNININCGGSFGFAKYDSGVLFQDTTLDGGEDGGEYAGAVLGTKVMSVDTVGGATENLDPPVEYLLEVAGFDGTTQEAICVFWDFHANAGTGGWGADGCSTVTSPETGSVTCQCTHMTNFAVLTRIKPLANSTNATGMGAADVLALDIITYVGIAVSVPALLLLVVVFAASKGLHTTNRFITGNLALTLAISLLIFVFGIDAVGVEAGCTAIAALLHYSLLAAFMWMMVDGWYLHRTFCRVFVHTSARDSLLPIALVAYGIPAIIVGVSLVVALDQYGGEQNCWLSPDGLIYAFIGPIAIVVAFNIFNFVRIVVVIYKVPAVTDGRDRKSSIKAKRAFRASASFLPVMGITWVFGLLAIEPNSSIVWVYLFTVCTALQGVLIFVFHFLLDALVLRTFLGGIGLARWSNRKTGSRSSTQFSTQATDYRSTYQAKRAKQEDDLYLSLYTQTQPPLEHEEPSAVYSVPSPTRVSTPRAPSRQHGEASARPQTMFAHYESAESNVQVVGSTFALQETSLTGGASEYLNIAGRAPPDLGAGEPSTCQRSTSLWSVFSNTSGSDRMLLDGSPPATEELRRQTLLQQELDHTLGLSLDFFGGNGSVGDDVIDGGGGEGGGASNAAGLAARELPAAWNCVTRDTRDGVGPQPGRTASARPGRTASALCDMLTLDEASWILAAHHMHADDIVHTLFDVAMSAPKVPPEGRAAGGEEEGDWE